LRALVTGGAGFIGSHLAERLLDEGHFVRVVDSFSPYYDTALKRANLSSMLGREQFELVEADLRTAELKPLLVDIDTVFHQAGQPGVRLSWSDGFSEYDSINVLATQRLLEAVRGIELQRFVYASSSSVYGNAARYPTVETDLPAPMSPYGVTKLAAEHLCSLYAATWNVPTISLRYFTVYGPRQRPDMAMNRLVSSVLGGPAFPLFGDGSHIRDFTYVGDVVAANLAAATAGSPPGTVLNIAGGGSITMIELIQRLGELAGESPEIDRHPPQPGDVLRTGGSIDKAREQLGWEPETSIVAGLQAQLDWARVHQPLLDHT
jgi:UDP-glucuronate 4-epimerase